LAFYPDSTTSERALTEANFVRAGRPYLDDQPDLGQGHWQGGWVSERFNNLKPQTFLMITNNLRSNQLSPEAYDRYLRYLQAMDRRDIAAYGEFLAADVVVQFNNGPPLRGKEAAMAGLGPYWQSFASIEHDLTNIYGNDTNYVLEALNHYLRHDGQPVTVRAVAFTDLNAQGQVESVRIYHDVTPVFA
jgi:ketosteroid isomerase-like protein